MTTKITKKEIGNIGESAACAYLKIKGHSILGRNLRLKTGEIDILSSIDGILHLVEVKTVSYTDKKDFFRSKELLYEPESNFSTHKLRKLRGLAKEVYASYPHNALFSVLKQGQVQNVLRDGEDTPSLQIDGLAVRLLIEGVSLKKARVKFFPFMI